MLIGATDIPATAAAHAPETHRGKAVRDSSQGKRSTMRHQASGAVGAYGVQLSQTDRGAQGVAGICSHGTAWNAFASSRGQQTVSPPPKEMSSIACPTQ